MVLSFIITLNSVALYRKKKNRYCVSGYLEIVNYTKTKSILSSLALCPYCLKCRFYLYIFQ